MAVHSRIRALTAALRLGLLAGVAMAPAALATSRDEPVIPQRLTTVLEMPAVTGFVGRPLVAAAWQVTLDAGRLRAAQSGLSLEVEGQTVSFRRDAPGVLPTGDLLLHARTEDSHESFPAILSARGLTAAFRMDDRLYRLVPLDDGQHLLIRVDETRLPPSHAQATAASAAPRHQAGTGTPAAAPSVIRVLVAASAEAAAGYPGDLRALAELSIAESNRTYDNSGLAMRLELAAFRQSTYLESRNMSLDVRRLVAPADGYLDELHEVRDRVGADVGMLMLDRAASCGEAAEIGADAATAFAAVLVDCATGQYTFAHEIGHLGGARHDLRRDPATSPYPFGHGYWYQPPRALGWRTVMSYDCPTGCRRIPYWSSPTLRHEGVPVGNAAEADNRRVLDITRSTVAGFR